MLSRRTAFEVRAHITREDLLHIYFCWVCTLYGLLGSPYSQTTDYNAMFIEHWIYLCMREGLSSGSSMHAIPHTSCLMLTHTSTHEMSCWAAHAMRYAAIDIVLLWDEITILSATHHRKLLITFATTLTTQLFVWRCHLKFATPSTTRTPKSNHLIRYEHTFRHEYLHIMYECDSTRASSIAAAATAAVSCLHIFWTLLAVNC